MAVRAMQPEDVEAVYKISTGCFSEPWTKAAVEKELTNPAASYFVAVEEGKVVGYGGMWHMADEGEVINIAVSLAYRNKQVGTQLLQALIEQAKSFQLTSMFLEVRESNKAAQALYHKMGFSEIGRRKNYYHAPKEDAVNMVCQLNKRDF